MKLVYLGAGLAALALGAPVKAQTPSGITVPPGFTATIVHDGVGPARHIAARPNGDLYISTRAAANDPAGGGIIALRDTNGDHRADIVEKIPGVSGTGIEFHGSALYASDATAIYRFTFQSNELVPSSPPQPIVAGMPEGGFVTRSMAFDDHGGMIVGIGSGGNLCADGTGPEPKGKAPCPDLETRAGIWRYDAKKPGQQHPADGVRMVTGLRDMSAIEWDAGTGEVYAAMQGRNSMARLWPKLYTDADNAGIADELFRLTAGGDMGWPYTYYDGLASKRMLAPEYGGDGKTAARPGFSEPVAVIKAHSSPLDLTLQTSHRFPDAWRNGIFIALHGGSDGPSHQNGYQIGFLPIDSAGRVGAMKVFADGFAGATPEQHGPANALYRPSGLAMGADGALYVVDSKKGRVWRIAYAASSRPLSSAPGQTRSAAPPAAAGASPLRPAP